VPLRIHDDVSYWFSHVFFSLFFLRSSYNDPPDGLDASFTVSFPPLGFLVQSFLLEFFSFSCPLESGFFPYTGCFLPRFSREAAIYRRYSGFPFPPRRWKYGTLALDVRRYNKLVGFRCLCNAAERIFYGTHSLNGFFNKDCFNTYSLEFEVQLPLPRL